MHFYLLIVDLGSPNFLNLEFRINKYITNGKVKYFSTFRLGSGLWNLDWDSQDGLFSTFNSLIMLSLVLFSTFSSIFSAVQGIHMFLYFKKIC